LSRWAAARASVTFEDDFGERCATMRNPLFLVAGSLPYRQEGRGRMSQARSRMSRTRIGRMLPVLPTRCATKC